MTCKTIAAHLDTVLRNHSFADVSNNGLQVENRGEITKVLTGVDASIDTFERAVALGAQMVVVHHGLSWGNSLARIDGSNYTLVSYLIKHNLALYACHLPLDAHPTLGNNAGLADVLNLQDRSPFFEYRGQRIGIAGTLPQPMSRDAFEALVRKGVDPERIERFDCGRPVIQTVGLCSGGAPEGIEQAAAAGLDIYVGGEVSLIAYNLAKHCSINALFAGHYATERFGVRALARLLREDLSLSAEFVDFRLPW